MLTSASRRAAYRGLSYHVAIAGGSALLLHQAVERPTQDVDVVAVAEGVEQPVPRYELPEDLRNAAADVSAAMGLRDPNWINSGAVSLIGDKLPSGYLDRCHPIGFESLTVSVLGRADLIRLKFYAATDEGPGSHHVQDLAAMHPTHTELMDAITWVQESTRQPVDLLRDVAALFGITL